MKLLRKHFRWAQALIVLVLLSTFYFFYRIALSANYQAATPFYLYVKEGEAWPAVTSRIAKGATMAHPNDLRLLATLIGVDPHVGAYRIEGKMNTLTLLKRIWRGHQSPVELKFNSVRLPSDLYRLLGAQLLMGEEGVRAAFTDTLLLRNVGVTDTTLAYHALPNTYEVYWTLTQEELTLRILKEYRIYWSETRQQQAQGKGLTPQEVTILASIVEEESSKVSEYPDIAGLYLNRLRRGMPLQADPTVKFAVGDFSLQRIRGEHLRTASPFNTYLHRGLPPAPIRIPSLVAIDGVLNAADHHYLYMCAKEDFSGYHNFAITHNEHMANARRYTAALNARNIQ